MFARKETIAPSQYNVRCDKVGNAVRLNETAGSFPNQSTVDFAERSGWENRSMIVNITRQPWGTSNHLEERMTSQTNGIFSYVLSKLGKIPSRYEEGRFRITYVGRKPGTSDPNCTQRHIFNAEEVCEKFTHFCERTKLCFFTGPVLLHTLSIRQQAQLMASTDILVGYYGSALSWAQVMPIDSMVVSVQPRAFKGVWFADGEVLSPHRDLTFVVAIHDDVSRYQKRVQDDPDEFLQIRKWNLTLTRMHHDDCRAWNATNVLTMLTFVLSTCKISPDNPKNKQRHECNILDEGGDVDACLSTLASHKQGCFKRAMLLYEANSNAKKHPNDAKDVEWVLQLDTQPYGFLQIADDACEEASRGREDEGNVTCSRVHLCKYNRKLCPFGWK